MDTIFAVSSGRPPAAIAVMRVSGKGAGKVLAALAGDLPTPRRASLRRLHDPVGTMLDEALVLWFPGPHTATGEDLAELHLHGGRAVVGAVEQALSAMPGLRRAEAGEFTRRALENSRIDLTQVEGLADLLEAETETQRRAAIASTEGRLSARIRTWLNTLANISADIEAEIDFSDEDDVGDFDHAGSDEAIAAWIEEAGATLARPTVEELRDGFRVVLAGPPNAGKSTLFNALIDRDAAIVTAIAGTTRDVLEARLIRDGRAYVLVDTAGLRDGSPDPVERIGIERANAAVATADLVLWLGDDAPESDRALLLHPRADLPGRTPAPPGRFPVSSEDLTSIAAIWTAIADRLQPYQIEADDTPLRSLQREAVRRAVDALTEAREQADLLVRSEALRYASAQLAQILGVDATELMLDAVFSRFCIGK